MTGKIFNIELYQLLVTVVKVRPIIINNDLHVTVDFKVSTLTVEVTFI